MATTASVETKMWFNLHLTNNENADNTPEAMEGVMHRYHCGFKRNFRYVMCQGSVCKHSGIEFQLS